MKIFATIILIVAYALSINFVSLVISRIGSSKSVKIYRTKYISKTINIALTVFFLIVLIMLLGIEYSQLSVFLSSIFAVIGVALFAQWSILSNITASLIIFFAFPYRVGDAVQIVDKDGDLSGTIEEISLFHVLIKRDNDLITYPNSLILQKAVIKLSSVNSATQPAGNSKENDAASA